MTVKNSHILSHSFLILAKITAHLVDVRMRFFTSLSAATNRNVPAILWRDEHNHPENLSHTLNNVLIHTRLTLTTALTKHLSQNSQSCFVHIAANRATFILCV